MSAPAWLRPLVARLHPRRRPAPRRPAARPRLEVLEDRTAPAAGDLDPTFGNGGKVITDFANGSGFNSDGASAVAVQSDGKIVVAGGSDGDFALARYTSAGFLDPTFGSGGR